MSDLQRSIDDVIESVRSAKDSGRSCALLVGAGCSVTAGIPAGRGFVERIQKDHRRDYQRADPKSYAQCMAQLAPAERRELIAGLVDKAQINWAHLAIAQLLKNGYVDRILTTKFDMLVARACALVGKFPATYDFAASQAIRTADLPNEAVIHLHGDMVNCCGLAMFRRPVA
jgi:NAD-dependent SIR2 family protein deacetylase